MYMHETYLLLYMYRHRTCLFLGAALLRLYVKSSLVISLIHNANIYFECDQINASTVTTLLLHVNLRLYVRMKSLYPKINCSR